MKLVAIQRSEVLFLFVGVDILTVLFDIVLFQMLPIDFATDKFLFMN